MTPRPSADAIRIHRQFWLAAKKLEKREAAAKPKAATKSKMKEARNANGRQT